MPITIESVQPYPTLNEFMTTESAAAVTALKRSACFAMSRGGKELFHTNFLSFVLEIEPDIIDDPEERCVVRAVQQALIGTLFAVDPPESVQTWREQNNLDLVVLAAPTVEANEPGFVGRAMKLASSRRNALNHDVDFVGVVVEAKFKALPTRDQLERYDQRLLKEVRLHLADSLACGDVSWGSVGLNLRDSEGDDATFVARKIPADQAELDEAEAVGGRGSPIFAAASGKISRVLLSPKAPQWLEDTRWTHISWQELIEAMKGAMSTSAANTGIVVLLRDYVQFTEQLLLIIEMASVAVDAFCVQPARRFSQLAEMHKPFVKLRIHDLVGKVAFDRLRERLLEELNALTEPPGDFKFKSFTFLSNGTPGLVLEYSRTEPPAKKVGKVKERKVGLGIQIQGTSYRHFVTASNACPDCVLFDLAGSMGTPRSEDRTAQGWWNIGGNEQTGAVRIQPGSGDSIANEGFFRYGADAFLYTQSDISTLNFSQLVQLVRASVQDAVRLINDNEFIEKANSFVQC